MSGKFPERNPKVKERSNPGGIPRKSRRDLFPFFPGTVCRVDPWKIRKRESAKNRKTVFVATLAFSWEGFPFIFPRRADATRRERDMLRKKRGYFRENNGNKKRENNGYKKRENSGNKIPYFSEFGFRINTVP